jgi:hypothetical protein
MKPKSSGLEMRCPKIWIINEHQYAIMVRNDARTYPLTVVLLLKTLQGMVGSAGTLASYRTTAAKPNAPMIKGAST